MVLITRKNGGGWWWGWTWIVQTIVAWTWIVVDSTDVANPIVWIDPTLLPIQQPSVSITSNGNIDVGVVYLVNATNWPITLWLNDWNSIWQTLTIKKIDSTDNSVFVTTNKLIDWYETIEISMEWESYDLYRDWSTFYIK